MWWIVLIIIVLIFVIRHVMRVNESADAVVKQGGMRKKYQTLVDHILSGDPRATIIQETSTFLNIGSASAGGTTNFLINQSFKNVTIEWRVNSPVFGKHKLEWMFDEFLDQDIMIKKIVNDVQKYTANVFQNFK